MKKRTELAPELLVAAIAANKIPQEARIVWREENVIYLATKETLADMLTDQPPIKFEIWMPEQKSE